MTSTRITGRVVRAGQNETPHQQLRFEASTSISATERENDFTDRVIIPGLVNGHAHSAMAVLRGTGEGQPLADWLQAVMAEEDRLTEADMRWSLSLAMCEMIKSGTTAFADMFHWTETLIDTVIEAGMRVAAAPVIFGPDVTAFRSANALTFRQQLDHVENLARQYAEEPLVRVMYGPHAIYTCGESTFSTVAARALDTGLGIHVHLSETAKEVADALRTNGRTPIESAAATGLLGPRTIIAHAVKPTPHDIQLIASSGATVVHNPQSNLKLGSGVAPVLAMLDAGIPVALGTDGPASNDSLDLLKDLRLAVSLQRGLAESPGAWDPMSALHAATTVGSQATGFPIATLENGSPADLAVLDASGAHSQPIRSVPAYVSWIASARDVRDVYVAGRPLLLNGELQTLDEERIKFEVRKIVTRLTNHEGKYPGPASLTTP